jgi:hypothetical protein
MLERKSGVERLGEAAKNRNFPVAYRYRNEGGSILGGFAPNSRT